MEERDYIIVSELSRLRAAFNVLRDVTIDNVADAVGVKLPRAQREWAHAMQCLDVWVARLEHSMHRYDEPDKEPWRREWPRGCKAWKP